MFRLLASGLALVGLMVLTSVFAQSAGSDPALTRSDSVLPPPPILEHPFYLNTAEARRFIRWDCSGWQPRPAVADAENQLASSILETLAENRGKTLYCGLDQSDTWTKRQVHDHAHRHNDRDRTQYDGSQGQGRFRGFTAGQEGWLTDGEHGITGVSPERIFEFPQEERRRRKKTIILRKKVSSGPVEGNGCPDRGGYPNTGLVTTIRDLNPLGDLICTNYGDTHPSFNDEASSYARARNVYGGGNHGDTLWGFDWRTRARYTYIRNTGARTYSGNATGNSRTEAQWIAAAERAATAACDALGGGYKYKRGSADFGRGHNNNRAATDRDHGQYHGWFYASWGNANPATHWRSRARESRTWSGVCTKRVRR